MNQNGALIFMPFVDNKGIKIHYKTIGQGIPLVMQHGFMSDHTEFVGYLDEFKDEFKLILIDLRGHGDSDKPHDFSSYSVEILTSDILAVLDDLNVEKAHYWGYSMGGHIGFGLATLHPERFLSYILGGITPQAPDEELKQKVQGFSKLMKSGADGFLAYLEKSGVEITAKVEEEIRSHDFESLYAFWASEVFFDDDRHMARIDAPILLYNGEKDSWGHHPRGLEYEEMRSNVKYISFPDYGHEVHEYPELITSSVKSFLKNTLEN